MKNTVILFIALLTLPFVAQAQNTDSDGVLLVWHDKNIEGKRIEKHPYEDFRHYRLKNGEPIPTVDQYMEQAKVKADGINGIDYNYNVLKLNKKWVLKAHSLGMSTNAWTVNKKDDMREMLNLKVNMLTTDQPLQARELMKEMNIKEL